MDAVGIATAVFSALEAPALRREVNLQTKTRCLPSANISGIKKKKNKNASSAGELVYILHMLIHLETALERSYNSKAARFERQNTLFVLSLLLI